MPGRGPLRDALERLVRFVMADVTYHRLYPATVQRVSPDGTADVLPDDTTIRGTGLRAAFLPGLPNTTIDVTAGARCLVGFRAGDPKRPYVAEWMGDGLARIGIDAGTRPLARMGDIIDVQTTPAQPIAGVIGGTLTVPGTPPVVTPLPPTPFQAVATLGPLPIKAQIQTGNPKILA
jgi:hypothetical protein